MEAVSVFTVGTGKEFAFPNASLERAEATLAKEILQDTERGGKAASLNGSGRSVQLETQDKNSGPFLKVLRQNLQPRAEILRMAANPSLLHSVESLELAVMRNDYKLAKVLLKNERIRASSLQPALLCAARSDDPRMVKLLLENGADSSQCSTAFIRELAESNKIAAIEALIAFGTIDPSLDANFLLQYAAKKNKSSLLTVLLNDSRVDPTVDENKAWKVALQKENFAAMDVLLAHPHVKGVVNLEEALYNAVVHLQPHTVKFFLNTPTLKEMFSLELAEATIEFLYSIFLQMTKSLENDNCLADIREIITAFIKLPAVNQNRSLLYCLIHMALSASAREALAYASQNCLAQIISSPNLTSLATTSFSTGEFAFGEHLLSLPHIQIGKSILDALVENKNTPYILLASVLKSVDKDLTAFAKAYYSTYLVSRDQDLEEL